MSINSEKRRNLVSAIPLVDTCVMPTVKVQRPRTVLVDLLNDSVEILLRELVVQLLENLLQGVGRDVSVSWRERNEGEESISQL